MKFRFLLILGIIIILSGCKSVYELEIRDSIIKENIIINMTDFEDSDIKYFRENKFYAIMDGASSFSEYKKKLNKNSVFFSYNYNINNYGDSTTLKTCFKAYSILDEDVYYVLSTSKGIKCAVEEDEVLLDSLDIVIKTNHVVKENNADEVRGYKYIWHFNKDNYNDKSIMLKFYKDKYVFNYNNEFVIQIGIIVGIVLTILIIVFIIRKKVKKANRL